MSCANSDVKYADNMSFRAILCYLPADSKQHLEDPPQQEARVSDIAADTATDLSVPATDLSSQSTTAPCTYTFSLTKLASSGIVMLQLHPHVCSESPEQSTCSIAQQADTAPSGNITDALAATSSSEANAQHTMTTEGGLPTQRTVQAVHKILEDLQAGALPAPE